ncbi:hypothetical protein AVEN_227555-2 [Araneus ventricosus]|uniref:Sushi domain-containing protein n=1 Tax=Araneus ventricosus TaxID=182803 RepID=A0A4Y2C5L1_ARAVE|nr:hypothetical protein AVEN_227555-2 [Araneus ventricosus]
MRGQYAQAANKLTMKIGSSVNYVRNGGMRNVSVTKTVEHLYATTAKFSGCVLLALRPAHSYPRHRLIVYSHWPYKWTMPACPPPDFPERGGYEPVKAEYEVGLTVSYYCNSSLLFFTDKDYLYALRKQVACQSSGKWTEGPPFCALMTNLIASSKDSKEFTINDDNFDTCFEIQSDAKEILRFSLEREAVSYSAVMCFGEGRGTFLISFLPTDSEHRYDADDVKDKCMLLDLRDAYSSKTEYITIQVSTGPKSSISMCEIVVYMKDDEWCEHPPEISVPNGQLEVNRSKAVLHCNEGFREKDGKDVYATCGNDKWSFLNVQCVGQNVCPPPDFPERGGYEPEKAEYQVGQTVSYYCNSSLLFFAENDKLFAARKQVTCQTSGKWTGGPPFCAIMTHLTATSNSDSKESSIIDGNWDTCFETRSDTKEILQFSLDREAAANSIALCFGEGRGFFHISFLPTDWGRKYAADDVKEKCKVLDLRDAYSSKTEYITIQVSTGPNSFISMCEIEVYMKDDEWCEHPPEHSVPNGQLEVGRSRAVLHCNEGFGEKDGKDVYATCGNGKWSFLSLQCVGQNEIFCDPVVGNVSPSEGEWENDGNTSEYSVGTKRTLNCKPGYVREGEPFTVTCLENGTWTRTTAACKKIFCDPVVGTLSPSEGEWESDGKTSEYSVGTKRTLNCKPGYLREGEPFTVTCLENGTWSRTTATCKMILCVPVVGNVSPSEGEWESDGKTSEYSVGTKRSLNCNPGYLREGEPLTVTCLENGTWTRTTATCKKNKLQVDYKILDMLNQWQSEWDERDTGRSTFNIFPKVSLQSANWNGADVVFFTGNGLSLHICTDFI